MTKKNMPVVSLVIPLYNEENGIVKFLNLLNKSTRDLSYRFEIIFIDDGSKDKTLDRLSEEAKKDKRIRVIALSRNYGKELALTAGIKNANGDAIITLDGDGQHPPSVIKKFIKAWEKGYDVVIGVRQSNRKEGIIKKYGSKAFYRLFNSISENMLIPGSTDFRLITKEVADDFVQIKHHSRITRGLIDWLGYDRTLIKFHANQRIAGEARYTIRKLLILAFDTLVSLSFFPLKVFSALGIFISIAAGILGLLTVVEQLILGDPLGLNITGTAYLAILIIFLSGIILIGQGMLSTYISHMYYAVGNRPLYSISKRKSINFKK